MPIADLYTDSRYALRSLKRDRLLTATIVLVLSCGMALSVLVFMVAGAVVGFRPAVRTPQRLVYIASRDNLSETEGITERDFAELSSAGDPIEGMFLYGRDSATAYASDDASVRTSELAGEMVSGAYFGTLGLAPITGRVLTVADDASGAPGVLVISERLWRRSFDADPGIVGRHIWLAPRASGVIASRGSSYDIVGVVPDAFGGLLAPWERADYWVPLAVRKNDYLCDEPQFAARWHLFAAGSLHNKRSFEAARDAITAKSAGLRKLYRPSSRGWTLKVQRSLPLSLHFGVLGAQAPTALAAAGLLLTVIVLTVCVINALGLLLVRATRRGSTIAISLALGATRGRLLRQLLFEAAALSIASTGIAWLLARWGARLVLSWIPVMLAQGGPVTPSPLPSLLSTLGVAVTLSAMVAGVLGVTVARHARLYDIRSLLTGNAAGTWQGMSARMQRGILLPLVTFSTTVIVMAATVTLDITATSAAPPGYRMSNVSFSEFNMPRPPSCEESASGAKAFAERRRAIVNDLTGPRRSNSATAVAMALPGQESKAWIRIRAADASQEDAQLWARANSVSNEYFSVLQIPLLSGRRFDLRDREQSEPVAVVSAGLAKQLARQGRILGGRVAFADPSQRLPPKWITVVGVVGDVRPLSADIVVPSAVYTPLVQRPIPTVILLRGSPATLQATADDTLAAAGSTLTLTRSSTLSEELERFLRPLIALGTSLATAGCAALIFCVIGIYCIVTHTTAQRIKEMCVRAALGASRAAILRLIVAPALRLSLIGTAAGAAVSIPVQRLMIYAGLPAPSIRMLPSCGAILLVVLIVVIAAYLSTRRALRPDISALLKA
jgi:putative ABC transport system permease protein